MKYLISLLFLVLSGCAAYKSYNQTTEGLVILRGGVFGNETWDDSLEFERLSWYHGMSLYYDTLIYSPDKNSPFFKWFSDTEKEYLSKCRHFVVTAGYSADPTKISHVSFREQMKLNGYDDVVVNNFASFLKTHPSSSDWRLQNYKILGFCQRSPSTYDSDKLIIHFPSFKEAYLEL